MIIGVGIDMVEVERVAQKVGKENGFKQRVFSEYEIAFCHSKTNSGEHFAARFAAKEAFLKAIGEGLLQGFDLHLIEILSDEKGKPFIKLGGIYKEMADEKKWRSIQVSLSHLNSIACAVVIIEA